MIFIRRFYLKVQIRKTNPYLLLVTAFYLACKVEETPQHIKSIMSEARQLWPGKLIYQSLDECLFLFIGAQISSHP